MAADRTLREEPRGDAPGTYREPTASGPGTPRAPGTVREPSSSGPGTPRAPGTYREPTAAPGPRTPGTVREPAAEASRPASRINLPPDLAGDYVPLFDLPSGSQADVLVARHLGSGERVVIKLYRQAGDRFDPAVEKLLDRADPAHIVRTMRRGTSADGRKWEVQEYCELGSLQGTAVRSLRSPFSTPKVERIVRELSGAVTYLHGLGVAHRDLKPANILIRTEYELDLVLADFGLSKQMAVSRVAGSIGGTFLYMPPEVFRGENNFDQDWWSLGVILAEMLHGGRHYLADSHGRLPSEHEVRLAISDGTYEIPQVGTARQRMLIRGLMTRETAHRWGAEEVARWLDGESPAVVEPEVGPQSTHTPPSRLAYVFAGTAVRSPAELARVVRSRWEEAAQAVAGRPDQALIAWLEGYPEGPEASRVLRSGHGPGPTLVTLQGLLDPAAPVEFRGVPLHSIGEHLARGTTDPGVQRWARAVRSEHALSGAAALGDQNAADAEQRLRTWSGQIDAQLARLSGSRREMVEAALLAVEPHLLAAALGDQGPLRSEALRIIRSTPDPGWASPVVLPTVGNSDLGTLVVAMAAIPSVAEEQRRARAERQAQAETTARTTWRNALRGTIVRRLFWALLWAAVGGSALVAANGPAASVRAVVEAGQPVLVAGVLAAAATIGVEAALLRRPLQARGALVTVALVMGARDALRDISAGIVHADAVARLPIAVGIAWIASLLLGWAIWRWGRRTPDGLPVTLQHERRTRPRWYSRLRVLALALGSLTVTTGLMLTILRIAAPVWTDHPAGFLVEVWSQPVPLARWFQEHIPWFDPLHLAPTLGGTAMLAAVAVLLVAGAADLRRLLPALGWVAQSLVVLGGLAVLFAAPWALAVTLLPMLGMMVVLGIATTTAES